MPKTASILVNWRIFDVVRDVLSKRLTIGIYSRLSHA